MSNQNVEQFKEWLKQNQIWVTSTEMLCALIANFLEDSYSNVNDNLKFVLGIEIFENMKGECK